MMSFAVMADVVTGELSVAPLSSLAGLIVNVKLIKLN